MKVLIAATGPTLDSLVAQWFGHAPYYLLVDSTIMQVQVIDNSEDKDETQAVIPRRAGQWAEVFITENIGPHAFQLAQSLNRRVALARRMSAREALDKLQRGELEMLSAPTVKNSMHDYAHH